MTTEGRVDASTDAMIQGSKGRSCTNTAMSSSLSFGPARAKSVLDCATLPADVSAFCRATLSRLIPNELWGIGEVGQENKNTIMCHVDRFVHARRFESLSLHVLSERLKVCMKIICPGMILLTKHRLPV